MATDNTEQKQLPQPATDAAQKASPTKEKHHSNRFQEIGFKDRVYCNITKEQWDLHEPLRKAADESTSYYYGNLLAGNLTIPQPVTITQEVIREVNKNIYVTEPLPSGKIIISKSMVYGAGALVALLVFIALIAIFKPKLPNLMTDGADDSAESNGLLSS
jgi:hypothetical protein